MSACRIPPESDPVRVDAQASGIRSNPANCFKNVEELRRVTVLGREPILDIHRYIAALDSLLGDPLHTAPVSPRPTSTMHKDDRWQRLICLGTMDIEDPAGVALVIGKVTTHLTPSTAGVNVVLRPHARTCSDSDHENAETQANRGPNRKEPHGPTLPAF